MEIPFDLQDFLCLLAKYNQYKYQLLYKFLSNPFSISNILEYISKDPNCYYQMGDVYNKYPSSYTLIKKYQCSNCKTIQWLLKNQPQYRLRTFRFPCPSSTVNISHNIESNQYSVSSEDFFHHLLVSWYLERVTIQLVPIYHAFICNRHGLYLIESSLNPIINIKNIELELFYDIFRQLIMTLENLCEVDFINHKITYTSLLYNESSIEYTFNRNIHTSKYFLKFNNFRDTEITICNPNIDDLEELLSNQDELSNIKLDSNSLSNKKENEGKEEKKEKEKKKEKKTINCKSGNLNPIYFSPIHKIIRSAKVDKSTKSNQDYNTYYYFKISKSPINSSRLKSWSEYPLSCIYLSYNLYGYLLLLMSNPFIFSLVKETPKLKKVWTSLWIPEELQIIESKLNDIHKNIDKEKKEDEVDLKKINFTSILMEFHLQPDILDKCLELVS
jgi:hypothetical protein